MTRWLCIILLMAFGAISVKAQSQPEVWLNVDFSVNQAAWIPVKPGNERMDGKLPSGWKDNSNWAQVWGTFSPVKEGGVGFLRIHATKYQGGAMMLSYPGLPRVTRKSLFRLTVRARCLSGDMTGRLDAGLRDAGAPYQWRWLYKPSFSPEWTDDQRIFSVDPIDGPVGIWFSWAGVGHYDIASIRLEQMDMAEYVHQLEEKMPASSPKNLVRSSRFPLGPQNGWAMERPVCDELEMSQTPDSSVPGISGYPSLKISATRKTHLFFEPLILVRPTKRHVVSLYVKGTGVGRLSVGSDSNEIAKATYALKGSTDWTRISVPLTPNIFGKYHHICLFIDQPTAGLWIDGLKVEEAEKPTLYASMMSAEVALACPKETDAAPSRIQFVDEPAEIDYVVTGAGESSILTFKVVDLYGNEKTLPPIVLKGAEHGCHRGTVRYLPMGKANMLGQYRLEAQVQKDGQPISPWYELVVTRLRRPQFWGKDAPESFFGTHTFPTRRHLLMAKAVGVNWARLHDAGIEFIEWSALEPAPGQWTFHDRELNRYRQYHMSVLGQLVTAPKWASRHPGNISLGYYDRFFMPKNRSDFGNYVRTVVQRYRGVIQAWDLWNEPYVPHFWIDSYDPATREYRQGADPANEYARLMETAYTQAKSVDSSTIISGFNTTGSGAGGLWTDKVAAANGLPYCDTFHYHDYNTIRCGYPDDRAVQGLRESLGKLYDPVTSRGPKPIWMTEGNPISGMCKRGFYHHTLPVSSEKEDWMDYSDRLVRYLTSLRGNGVEKVFLYSMHVHSFFGWGNSNKAIVTDDGFVNPSAVALAALAWHTDGMKAVKQVELAPRVYGYLFELPDASRSVVVISPNQSSSYVPPTGVGAIREDLFGNSLPPDRPVGTNIEYLAWNRSAKELLALLNP